MEIIAAAIILFSMGLMLILNKEAVAKSVVAGNKKYGLYLDEKTAEFTAWAVGVGAIGMGILVMMGMKII